MKRLHGDRGDTLVEILAALMVLGIGITALLGGLVTNITATGVNRDQAQVSAILLSASEHVKSLGPLACGGGVVAVDPTEVPHESSTFSVSYGPATAFNATTPCSVMYRVPVRVTGNGFDVSLDVVKRS